MIYARLQTALLGANLTHAAFVQNTLPVNRGFLENSRSQQLCSKQSGGQEPLWKLLRTSALMKGSHNHFKICWLLLLNLFYKKEGLQYHRICSKILTIFSSFLKTSQQLVIWVAKAPTILCAKVRIETIIEFIRQVEKYQHHPKWPWDSESWPQSFSINHNQLWDT